MDISKPLRLCVLYVLYVFVAVCIVGAVCVCFLVYFAFFPLSFSLHVVCIVCV